MLLLRRALPAAAALSAVAPGAIPHGRRRAAGPGQQEVSDGSETGAGGGWDGAWDWVDDLGFLWIFGIITVEKYLYILEELVVLMELGVRGKPQVFHQFSISFPWLPGQ